jgi:hypothetical protein
MNGRQPIVNVMPTASNMKKTSSAKPRILTSFFIFLLQDSANMDPPTHAPEQNSSETEA